MPMLRMDTAGIFDYITNDPHDRVRGHHYPQSGGQSRTAYIISQRREIEKLRAAGVDVDADIKEAALSLFIRRSVADPYYHHHDRAGLPPVHDDLSPAPRLEVETDKQQFDLNMLRLNLFERQRRHKAARRQKMIHLTPAQAVRPEVRFLDRLFAIMRDARQFHHDGLESEADAKRAMMRDFVRDSGLSAMFTEQTRLLDAVIALSYRPFQDKPPPVILDAWEVYLSSPCTYYDCATAVDIEQCVSLSDIPDAPSAAYTDQEAALEPLAAAAKPIEDNAGTVPPIVTVEDAQSLPVMSTKYSATAVAIEQALDSEAASCVYTFEILPVAVRKCGTLKKKKKQKLNSKEALPSKEAYSGFNVSSG